MFLLEEQWLICWKNIFENDKKKLQNSRNWDEKDERLNHKTVNGD